MAFPRWRRPGRVGPQARARRTQPRIGPICEFGSSRRNGKGGNEECPLMPESQVPCVAATRAGCSPPFSARGPSGRFRRRGERARSPAPSSYPLPSRATCDPHRAAAPASRSRSSTWMSAVPGRRFSAFSILRAQAPQSSQAFDPQLSGLSRCAASVRTAGIHQQTLEFIGKCDISTL